MGICRWLHRLVLNAILLLAVLAPVSAAPTSAATQTLSVDGSNPGASDTICAPCKTIQGAINLAGAGAGITVAPGTYTETLAISQGMSISMRVFSKNGATNNRTATIVSVRILVALITRFTRTRPA